MNSLDIHRCMGWSADLYGMEDLATCKIAEIDLMGIMDVNKILTWRRPARQLKALKKLKQRNIWKC